MGRGYRAGRAGYRRPRRSAQDAWDGESWSAPGEWDPGLFGVVWGPGCSRGAIRIFNSLPTRGYKLTPLSELVLPESHHLRPNFANLSVWIPVLLSPSPALTSALLLFPQPTSFTLSFPVFLPLLHPSHLTVPFPAGVSPFAAPRGRARTLSGGKASGRPAGLGLAAGRVWGENQQMFAIRRGPRRPRPPRPGRGPAHPQLWGRRELGRKAPRSAQADGEVHSGETHWPFSENSHLLILPASFRHPHPGILSGEGLLPPLPPTYCLRSYDWGPLDLNPSFATSGKRCVGSRGVLGESASLRLSPGPPSQLAQVTLGKIHTQ